MNQQCISRSQTHLKLPNIERICYCWVCPDSYTCISIQPRWYLCLKQVIVFYDASSYMMFTILYEFRITEAWRSSYFCINCKLYKLGVHHQCVKYMFKYLNKFFFLKRKLIFSLFYFVLGILDLILNFPGYHRWRFTRVLRNILKIIVSLAWAIILPVFYMHTSKMVPKKIKDMLSFLGEVKGISPLYILAVAIYLLPNLLVAALFIFPMLRRWIENSDWHIIRFLLWWSQVIILLCFSYILYFYILYHLSFVLA